MSATNRGAIRVEYDFYATPAWCVRALMSTIELPAGRYLEPACGDGAIISAILAARDDIHFDAMDIDAAHETAMAALPVEVIKRTRFMVADFITKSDAVTNPRQFYDVVITNPPYKLALEFVQASLQVGRVVVMLLRLPWLASQSRNAFLLDNPPSVYILPRRPSFTGNGTDATDYAWMVWGMDAVPTCRVINSEVCK